MLAAKPLCQNSINPPTYLGDGYLAALPPVPTTTFPPVPTTTKLPFIADQGVKDLLSNDDDNSYLDIALDSTAARGRPFAKESGNSRVHSSCAGRGNTPPQGKSVYDYSDPAGRGNTPPQVTGKSVYDYSDPAGGNGAPPQVPVGSGNTHTDPTGGNNTPPLPHKNRTYKQGKVPFYDGRNHSKARNIFLYIYMGIIIASLVIFCILLVLAVIAIIAVVVIGSKGDGVGSVPSGGGVGLSSVSSNDVIDPFRTDIGYPHHLSYYNSQSSWPLWYTIFFWGNYNPGYNYYFECACDCKSKVAPLPTKQQTHIIHDINYNDKDKSKRPDHLKVGLLMGGFFLIPSCIYLASLLVYVCSDWRSKNLIIKQTLIKACLIPLMPALIVLCLPIIFALQRSLVYKHYYASSNPDRVWYHAMIDTTLIAAPIVFLGTVALSIPACCGVSYKPLLIAQGALCGLLAICAFIMLLVNSISPNVDTPDPQLVHCFCAGPINGDPAHDAPYVQ